MQKPDMGHTRSMRIVTRPDELVTSSHVESCLRVVTYLEQEYTPTHIVLDSNNYTQDNLVIDEFRDVAFTWTRDRPIDCVPSYFVEIVRDPACTHLVWLSRKALAYSELMFVWVLAHELRHVCQSRQRFPREKIRSTVQQLRRNPSYANLPAFLFAPEEIDSELSALRIVGALYGEDELNCFLALNSLPRCPYPSYISFLQQAAIVYQA